MDLVWVVLGIGFVAVVLYFTAAVVFGPGEPPEPAGEDLASPLPEGRDLTAHDLRTAVLPVAVRGYRMSDVDALIERMAQQIARAEARESVQRHGEPDPPRAVEALEECRPDEDRSAATEPPRTTQA